MDGCFNDFILLMLECYFTALVLLKNLKVKVEGFLFNLRLYRMKPSRYWSGDGETNKNWKAMKTFMVYVGGSLNPTFLLDSWHSHWSCHRRILQIFNQSASIFNDGALLL